MINANFWQGKRVFLTGHTGFKGSWLSLWLKMLGANVLGFSLEAPTNPNLFELVSVSNNIDSVIGDVRDLDALLRAMTSFQPEIVIHLAAQPLVRYSYQFPAETFNTNVMGTVHLFEAIRQVSSVRAVVDITSDKCYENKEWTWGYREIDALGGYDPYSASKACAELVASAYRNSFFNADDYQKHGVAIATARAGNVIGGGDWAADRLIPDSLNALFHNETIYIRSPYATRPWQHVLEPLNGYLMLAEKLYLEGTEYAESWNFGPDTSNVATVGNVVGYLCQLWGNNASWDVEFKASQPHENTLLMLDCAKAHRKLGWHPQLDLPTTLTWIVDWAKAYQAGEDMQTFTQSQINQFMQLNPVRADHHSTQLMVSVA